jgi:hypothetical protein
MTRCDRLRPPRDAGRQSAQEPKGSFPRILWLPAYVITRSGMSTTGRSGSSVPA